ncbi:MAG: hypothetical protein KGH72_01375 [Candidatus Micrarchaeota archaeon]|nr:hypothetical protein [Candidatus Micrarchaeota archaeon]
MRSKNAKRIAAVAASLLMGFAFAGSGGVNFNGTIPIINSAGTPVVQIVVGSGQGTQYTPSPSDGVVAANIAAVIGNLAFTSQNVTATVSGQSNVNCVVTRPTCTLTNQQVWLGEQGLTGTGGSYAFYAIIGSVFNSAIQLSQPGSTKSIQGAGSQYAYQELPSLIISPVMSPYTAASQVPYSTVQSNNNGGGVSFNSGFGSGSGTATFDNLLRVSSAQLTTLTSSWGTHQQSSYLWLAGFPVFDQATGVNNFRLMSATGAYQTVFGSPIQINASATSSAHIAGNLNVPIKFLGQNYTILQAYSTTTGVTSSNVINGGKLELAAALVPATIVYVGDNISTGPFTVQLQDLGQPNSTGATPASVAVYYHGVKTNTTSINEFKTQAFNVSGQKLFVNVQQTFAGLYAYEKWAKIQLYSNLLNITDGQVYNQTNDPGWTVNIYWTNTSSSSSANAVALQSIVVYNRTPTTLAPGQSFTFIQNPAAWKITFVGDSLSPAGFDSVSATAQPTSSITYQNIGAGSSGVGASAPDAVQLAVNSITEPASELTVTSSIPNAFTYAGQQSATVTYLLDPYQLNEIANTMRPNGNTIAPGAGTGQGLTTPGTDNVILTYQTTGGQYWITSTNPLTVTIQGFTSNTAGKSPVSSAVQFTTNSGNQLTATAFFNVTNIQLSRPLPGNPFTVAVWANSLTNTANVVQLANLTNVPAAGEIIYGPLSGQTYYSLSSAATNVVYNGAQSTETFALTPTSAKAAGVLATPQQYYSYTFNEVAVPSNTLIKQSGFAFGIVNSTGGVSASPLFQLNYSGSATNAIGQKNNITYIPSLGNAAFNVMPGFVGERGSKVVSISPTTISFNLAKSPDQLLFVVGRINGTAATTTQTFGPYKIGQATNIANVTIANVSASCSGGNTTSASCTVTGLGNLTATPSISHAVTPVHLNTVAQPLVVLDTNANQSSNLIVVGSKYVNAVAAQIFQQNPSLDSSFGPGSVIASAEGNNRILVAGYSANETVQAGNQFIGQLLQSAGT